MIQYMYTCISHLLIRPSIHLVILTSVLNQIGLIVKKEGLHVCLETYFVLIS